MSPVATTADAPSPPARRPLTLRRTTVAWAAVSLALGLSIVAGLFLGSGDLPLERVWGALVRAPGIDPEAISVVWGLRVPRSVLALCIGAALGLAGALMQIHTRNPLADPGLLGVSAGGGMGVVLGLSLFGLVGPEVYVWWAVLGACVGGVVVLFLGARAPFGDAVTSLVVTGAVVSALCSAVTTAIVLIKPTVARAFQGWAAGTVTDRPLSLVVSVAPVLLLGLLLAVLNAGSWATAALGEEAAAALGRHVVRDRLLGAGAVVALAAAATAVAGTIAFVGLLAPHLARWLFGDRAVQLVLATLPLGAALVLAGDALGRVVGSLNAVGAELPVGVALAILGAPTFVFLARRWGR